VSGFSANFDVYGSEKVWRQLGRERIEVGRDRVARLMAELELVGAVRGKTWWTTISSHVGERPADLVDRNFSATAPNRLWVTDLTYVSTWPGVVYTAFVTDVFSRYIVGWKVSTNLRSELALDALEMAIWSRGTTDLKGLVDHSDPGCALVAVNNCAWVRLTLVDCHAECAGHQGSCRTAVDRQPDHAPRPGVEDDGAIDLSISGRVLRHVGDPEFISLVAVKLAGDPIFCGRDTSHVTRLWWS
jgi:Integrase core domain/HTH-like domain